MKGLYAVLVLDIYDQIFDLLHLFSSYDHMINFLHLFISELLSFLTDFLSNINFFSEEEALLIIHHSIFIIDKIINLSDCENHLFYSNLFSVFPGILKKLNEIFLKFIKLDKTLIVLLSFIKMIVRVFEICRGDKEKLLKIKNGLTPILVEITYNVIKPSLKITENLEELIKNIIKLFDLYLRDDLNLQQLKRLMEIVFTSVNEHMKLDIKYNLLEPVMIFMYNCISWGIKAGKIENVLIEGNNKEIENINENLLDCFNKLNKLLCDDNFDKITKLKWCCSITFGFLNKGRKVERKKYSDMIKFLKECKNKKIPIIESENRWKLAKDTLEFINF
jgi:hypothetical protein